MDLFDTIDKGTLEGTPLAEVMRPKDLEGFVGQSRVLDKGGVLDRSIQKGRPVSLIFWGPPGCGKTTLARILSKKFAVEFVEANAIETGVKKIRELGEAAKIRRRTSGRGTALFVDEIHRFNKSQQDVLLPFVEAGEFCLLGATTENPSYYLNRALLSRCRVLEFLPLSDENLSDLLTNTCDHLGVKPEVYLDAEAIQELLSYADGDARKLISAVEVVHMGFSGEPISGDELCELLGKKVLPHDKDSDQHYDLISAMIKSIRGSDPDASVYYLARMIAGGEDPRFIARRLVVLASEDIGNADPRALQVAVNAAQAVEMIGLPEVRICLSQAVIYLASAPKSNRSYLAIDAALDLVEKTGNLPVPKALRSSNTSLMKSFGYGRGYKYSHEGPKGYLSQEFLPEDIVGTTLYEPVERGFERHIAEYLKWMKSGAEKPPVKN